MRHGVAVISFGDRVHTAGSAGRIRHMILDREQYQLRGLVLRRGARPVDCIVPVPMVAPRDDDHGLLRLRHVGKPVSSPLPRRWSLEHVAAALDDNAACSDCVPAAPFGTAHLVLLRAEQPVHGPDGPIGWLQRIVVTWPGPELVALIVRIGRLRQRSVRIPRTSIVGWAGDQVHINRRQADVWTSPEYRPDSDIRSAIRHALYADETIWRVDGSMIAVHVSDGCVTLTGHLAQASNRDRAEQVARTVRGVQRVQNDVVTDAALTHAIAQALTRVDYASRAGVSFTVTHGTVMLFGRALNVRARRDIEAAVAEVPEVRMVLNEITAPDTPKPTTGRLMQPRRGQNVFARDGYLGRVERVVLDSRLRQATAIMLDSRVQSTTQDWLDDAPIQQCMLILPADTIKTLSRADVFLTIDRRTAGMAAEFHPQMYVAPPPWWSAPFPYEREEIMFEAPVTHGPTTRPLVPISERPARQVRAIPIDKDTRYVREAPVGVGASD